MLETLPPKAGLPRLTATVRLPNTSPVVPPPSLSSSSSSSSRDRLLRRRRRDGRTSSRRSSSSTGPRFFIRPPPLADDVAGCESIAVVSSSRGDERHEGPCGRQFTAPYSSDSPYGPGANSTLDGRLMSRLAAAAEEGAAAAPPPPVVDDDVDVDARCGRCE